jgi:hypothetical protein
VPSINITKWSIDYDLSIYTEESTVNKVISPRFDPVLSERLSHIPTLQDPVFRIVTRTTLTILAPAQKPRNITSLDANKSWQYVDGRSEERE